MTPDERLAEQKSFARVKELIEKPVSGRFDVAHLKEIHRRIFQDSPQHGPGQFRPFTPVYIKMRSLESTGHRYRVTYAPARDLEVTARAFPGLDFERASTTPNRAECEAWLSFVSKCQDHVSLAALIQQFLQGV